MNARRLLYWGDLDERRRRRGPGPWVYSAGGGLLMAAEIARSMQVFGDAAAGGATPVRASSLWLVAVVASHVVVLLGAPFRMFWRHDSAMIGRSAIRGQVIFAVALIRSARAAARVTVPCAVAALVFMAGPHGSIEIALRHLALVGVAGLTAGLLGPALALGAGAIVASTKAQALLNSMGGEFQAPKTSWLGVLPGVAGSALVLLAIAVAGWTRGADTTAIGDPRLVLVIMGVLPVVAVAWAYRRADRVMLEALREVAALDQERLAHIDLSRASPLERLAGRLAPRSRLVIDKDARLARRRYPIPFFVGFVGMVTLWILAIARPEDMMVWVGVIGAGIGAYGVVMARRSMVPPIEHARFLRTLPIAAAAVRTAKRARVVLWVVVYIGLGAAPVIVRAADPGIAGVVLGGVALATLVSGWAVTRGA